MGSEAVKRSQKYNTKQSQAIIGYIASLGGGHATVAEIAKYFESVGSPIGLATIYRHLDRLAEAGKVRKYFIDGASSACYQHIPDAGCAEHFHLKCDGCGATLHLRCGMLDKIPKHVYEEHSFLINTNRMVFYGKCAACQKDTANE
jgi:Fur family ferric uptake transcriptional regulator